MNKINYDNYLYIEGDESGYMSKYATLWETYKALKEIKEFDKRQGIKDTYHIMWVCKGVEREIKITKRKEKLYWKKVNNNV